MNYEPFDYEKYKAGRKAVTRDGRKVTQLVRFEADISYPLYGVIDGLLIFWCADGKYRYVGEESENDLFLLPEVREVWVAVDEEGGCFWTAKNDEVLNKQIEKNPKLKKAKLIIYV